MPNREISYQQINVKKTVGVVFPSKEIKIYLTLSIFLSGTKIKFSDKVRYLGIFINQYLQDDDDIKRLVKMLYSAANKLRSRFVKCSSTIKICCFVFTVFPYMVVIYSTVTRNILLIACMLAAMMLTEFCITYPVL